MARIEWDKVGERKYETGVDRCVLYPIADDKAYKPGVAWNGITSISESPSGAETTSLWADNVKYLNLISAEEFGCSVEAYMYPEEFEACDGTASLVDGLTVGQQSRKTFGLCYRTKIGNDVDGQDAGYKLHLIYGCTASPSQKGYSTVNDSPEAISFSWEIKTTPVNVPKVGDVELKSTSTLVIDSTKFTDTTKKGYLAKLEDILYGSDSQQPELILPDAVYSVLTTGELPSKAQG